MRQVAMPDRWICGALSHLATGNTTTAQRPSTRNKKNGLVHLRSTPHFQQRAPSSRCEHPLGFCESCESVVTRELKSAPRKLSTPQITLGHFRVQTRRQRNGVAFRKRAANDEDYAMHVHRRRSYGITCKSTCRPVG